MADFDKAIELNPDDADAYVIRGDAYFGKGDFDRAMENYKKAIELNSSNVKAYYNIGLVWMQKQNWQEAKLNLTVARILKADIVVEFNNIYGSVTDFDKQNDVQMPEDIATMLTP